MDVRTAFLSANTTHAEVTVPTLVEGQIAVGILSTDGNITSPTPSTYDGAWTQHINGGTPNTGTLFEEMGFNYIGPVDGHDVDALVGTLENMRKLHGPQLLHVVTQKGKGYAPAEADPIKWHGPGPFDPASGEIRKEKAAGPTYRQVFGDWLCDAAAADPLLAGLGAQPWFYFVHGYYLPATHPAVLAHCEHGVAIGAVVRQRNFWGVQFHPERSARAGAQLIDNFLRTTS
jgi:hypothetical protein